MRRIATVLCGVMAIALLGAGHAFAQAPTIVSAHDGGLSYKSATHECQRGHKIEMRNVTLDSGAVRYAFQYSGCVDPSHEGKRPSSEGNFGMPQPISGNWYWGGFMKILINGTDATNYAVEDWRVIETGARGGFQVVFAHPDAEVSLRMMMLPGGNHVLAALRWRPRGDAVLKTVAVDLRCYPSFFTSARNRDGERHCRTPRTDATQGETLQVDPAADGYLYFYDTVFDVEKGEGDGPCAALVAPDGLTGGRVTVGSYAVTTRLDYAPDTREVRLGFYDFAGSTNAEAAGYLSENGDRDLGELIATDFRPLSVRTLDVEALRAEATSLLSDAGEDGEKFRKQMDELIENVATLKAEADAGNIRAEADLGAQIDSSADLFWKLKAFAVLNNPDR